jgi:hypothetical protein
VVLQLLKVSAYALLSGTLVGQHCQCSIHIALPLCMDEQEKATYHILLFDNSARYYEILKYIISIYVNSHVDYNYQIKDN